MLVPIVLEGAVAQHVMPIRGMHNPSGWQVGVDLELVWSSAVFTVPNGRPPNYGDWSWSLRWKEGDAYPAWRTPPYPAFARAFELAHIPGDAATDRALTWARAASAGLYHITAGWPGVNVLTYGYIRSQGTTPNPYTFDGDAAGDGVSAVKVAPLTEWPRTAFSTLANAGGGSWAWGLPDYALWPGDVAKHGYLGVELARATISYWWTDGLGNEGDGTEEPEPKKPGVCLVADTWQNIIVAASLSATAQGGKRALAIHLTRAGCMQGASWEKGYTLCDVDEDSALGLAFLPNGLLTLSYVVGGTTYYRTNDQGGVKAGWSTPATTSRAARALNAGRANGQTWRVRT